MTTTRNRHTLYLDPEVDKYLQSVPLNQRTHWINQACLKAIEAIQQVPDIEARLAKLETVVSKLAKKLLNE